MPETLTLKYFIEKGGFFPLALKHAGTVYVFCRIDAGHLGRTGKIILITSTNGADWQRRGIIAKNNTDMRNPSVFIFPDGKILAAVYKYNAYDKNGLSAPAENKAPDNYGTYLFTSIDGGFTWTEMEQADFSLVVREIGAFCPHGAMFSYNNQLLMPVYNKNGAFLLTSKNEGKHWEIFTKIASDLLEPSVIKTPGNKLLAVMRSGRKSKWAESCLLSRYDNNEWSQPAVITEPMQHPANLLALHDGRLLLSYSDRNYDHQRILLKISKNDGLSWSNEIQLGGNFQNSDFGYPSTIETTPGKFMTVFYVNQVENPYFYFSNPDLYTDIHVKGCYYLYSLNESSVLDF
jgi:hypothetical protein